MNQPSLALNESMLPPETHTFHIDMHADQEKRRSQREGPAITHKHSHSHTHAHEPANTTRKCCSTLPPLLTLHVLLQEEDEFTEEELAATVSGLSKADSVRCISSMFVALNRFKSLLAITKHLSTAEVTTSKDVIKVRRMAIYLHIDTQ